MVLMLQTSLWASNTIESSPWRTLLAICNEGKYFYASSKDWGRCTLVTFRRKDIPIIIERISYG